MVWVQRMHRDPLIAEYYLVLWPFIIVDVQMKQHPCNGLDRHVHATAHACTHAYNTHTHARVRSTHTNVE